MLNAFRHQRFNTSVPPSSSCFSFPCSTPFGIRDSTLAQKMIAPYVTTVLNAFRHQRFNTQPPCIKILIAICAQRLSASEIQHETPMLRSVTRHRAQRLSASEIQHKTTSQSLASIPSAQRLSASEIQHYGVSCIPDVNPSCSTPFGIRDSTLISVLSHTLINLCSTPFGIRDSTP